MNTKSQSYRTYVYWAKKAAQRANSKGDFITTSDAIALAYNERANFYYQLYLKGQ